MRRWTLSVLSLLLMLTAACARPRSDTDTKHSGRAAANAKPMPEVEEPDIVTPEVEVDASSASEQPSTPHQDDPGTEHAEPPSTPHDDVDPVADDPTVDVVDEPNADEPNADEPNADEPNADEPKAEAPKPDTEPLAPLPHPREGACAFVPPPDPAAQVDNPNCPNGVYPGNLMLDSDAAAELARGCTRIRGHVSIYPSHITNLRALSGVRVVDGNVDVSTGSLCAGQYPCAKVSPPLGNLDGLEALECVGGSLGVYAFESPIEISALRNVVEIGGGLSIHGKVPGSDDAFISLRRVWLDAYFDKWRNTPRLEAVYGQYYAYNQAQSPANVYVGCAGSDYCRDGVLGCSFTATNASELAKLSNCEIAGGSLLLTGEAVANVTALAKLRYALNGITFRDAGVKTLAPLQSLELVSQLEIANLPQLEQFDAFSNVEIRLLGSTEISNAQTASSTSGRVTLADLPQLQNLSGLSKVESLGLLSIKNCDGLTDLSGLESLRDVGSVSLEGNAGLLSLDGMPELQTLRQIGLYYIPNLVDISGLSGLSSTSVVFWDLLNLADLTPLSGVELTDVHVVMLPELRTLDGLEGVRENAGWIDLQKNKTLEDIRALRNVRTAREVEVYSNPSLRSLEGLDQLESVTVSSEIARNVLLPQCQVDALHARIPLLSGRDNDTNATCTP